MALSSGASDLSSLRAGAPSGLSDISPLGGAHSGIDDGFSAAGSSLFSVPNNARVGSVEEYLDYITRFSEGPSCSFARQFPNRPWLMWTACRHTSDGKQLRCLLCDKEYHLSGRGDFFGAEHWPGWGFTETLPPGKEAANSHQQKMKSPMYYVVRVKF